MKISLTNIGHRYINEQLVSRSEHDMHSDPFNRILVRVLNEKILEEPLSETHYTLIGQGLLEIADSEDLTAVAFRYKTNPLENVQRIVFEITTDCNFNCSHCRNGRMGKTTEINIERLKSTIPVFSKLGIKRYDFIGGEVTKYGNGWLELAKYINCKRDNTLTIYTNGWWLENTDFEAAGKAYRNDSEYLADLYRHGITHILFSIDGHEEAHDKSRNQKGLYHKIISSFDRIKQSGIEPRITALIKSDPDIQALNSLADISTRIYDLPYGTGFQTKLLRLMQDSTNVFSNFIDIGNGVHQKMNRFETDKIPLEMLRCKAFYRPSPNLRIMANGNLSVCPLLDAGEGFGSVHNQSIIDILNNFHKSFIYKLHASNEIVYYLKYYDKKIFGTYYDHICSVRTILTLIAKYLNTEDLITSERVFEISKRIAQYSGHG